MDRHHLFTSQVSTRFSNNNSQLVILTPTKEPTKMKTTTHNPPNPSKAYAYNYSARHSKQSKSNSLKS
jgi:hypothetical protein